MRNWGRWARDDDPRLGVPPPPWAQSYRSVGNAREAGWGDPGVPEDLPPPIDEAAALRCDHWLRRLPPLHFRLLRRHYFIRAHQPEIELQAALRALIDVAQNQQAQSLAQLGIAL